ncbi:magnesium chelatase subunit D [Brevundimonas sp. AJA228-03]|uniref:magnesium chelatase subunit D n=1 Tax=Brevundimonas sp. AJA228-03 TaxID=2752515 RepID=UPI001ADFAA38|nr:magnesium chelatase subunit D [Brevundimonas sp. AJA228-03]QTN20345.1 magnesium chelatase subunit D [Brevundimonas sp. AJA228-03]
MTGADAQAGAAQDRWADAMLVAALLAVDPGLGGVAIRAGPGPTRDAWLSGFRALHTADTPWRRMPPGIGDDRLLGGLDLAAALGAGQRMLQRGVLAEADGGVVIAPMAERMATATAARLAGAIEDGAVRVERDGVAERLATRFVLVALDEGLGDELPPEALMERLAFRIELDSIGHRDALPISATPDDIAEARAALAEVAAPGEDAVHAICSAADALGVWSLRAPRLALRTAAALAALEGRDVIERDDLSNAARLVLSPRATRIPAPPEAEPDAAEAQPEPDDVDTPQDPQTGGEDDGPDDTDRGQGALDDIVLEAARAALPEGLEDLWLATGAVSRAAPARSGASGARLPAARRGRRIGTRPGQPDGSAGLDLVETLKAAAPWQRLRGKPTGSAGSLRVCRDDFRIRRFEQRSESTVIFVVDASGSAALQRLAETKGAVELLLAEAYVRRTQVALIAFRGETADLRLPPTRSLARARRQLAELAGGGATPLAAGLEAAAILGVAERAKGRTPLLVFMTDGRGNIALDGGAFRTRAEQDALNACRRIRAAGLRAALIDISPRPRGEGARLAEAMGATFATLPYVEAGRVRDVVRSLED